MSAADDPGAHEAGAQPPGGERAVRLPLRARAILVAACLVLVGGALGAVIAARGTQDAARALEQARAGKAAAGVPAGYRAVVDRQVGFTLAIPSGWRILRPRDPQVRLVAAGSDGASLLVRAVDLGMNVSKAELKALRTTITDPAVRANKRVKVLTRPRAVRVGGLRGLFYLYTFRDAPTRARGAHSHYFLFDRDRMLTLVFQALPAERFGENAPTFDTVVESFRLSG